MLQPEEETYTQMLAATVGLTLERLQLTDVLQTALFHLQQRKKVRIYSFFEKELDIHVNLQGHFGASRTVGFVVQTIFF